MNADMTLTRNSNFEQDRDELRVELNPRDSVDQNSAAWRLGRLLNEMRYSLQRSWLLFGEGDGDRTTISWISMQHLGAVLPDSQDFREQLTFAVERARQNWESNFRQEWHSDLLLELEDELEANRAQGPYLSIGEVEKVELTCQFVSRLMSDLVNSVTSSVSDQHRRLVELAMTSDEIIHPQLSSRFYTFQCTQSFQSSFDQQQTSNSQERSRVPTQNKSPLQDTAWRFRLETVLGNYFESLELERRFRRLGWAELPEASNFLDRLFLMVDLHQENHANETDLPDELTDVGWSTLERLGLQLIGSNLQRDGSDESVPLPPLERRLFFHFLNHQGERCDVNWLKSEWGRFSSRNAAPANCDVVRSAISRMNRSIRKLGVEVCSDRDGYSIRPIQLP